VRDETRVLDLTLFDVSDGTLDSDVLLDNFKWSIDPPGVGTVPQQVEVVGREVR